MNRLILEIQNQQEAYRPGDQIDGIASWEVDEQPTRVEVRLFYHTEGKGYQEVKIAKVVSFDNPQTVDSQIFGFILPTGPYSFTAPLVSLIWSIELVVLPKGETEQITFRLQPGEQAIKLSESTETIDGTQD